MVGSSCNVYVSITGPKPSEHDSSHRPGYHRPQHTWLISIEPHHSHLMPGIGHKDKDREPIHYAATWDAEAETYAIATHSLVRDPGIIGNILIVEEAHVSTERLHGMLKEDVSPLSPPSKRRDHASSEDEPEHWLRGAIHGLQHRNVAQKFDVDEFFLFAHGYVANRLENEAPALIAYPKIHKEADKKSSKSRFWVSTPTQHRTRKDSSGQAKIYGGLM
ncbi:hypothetical protein BDY17DRAFT_345987 [Neohortaea acidophila]|uniref:Uncharacterized protein n=1 Tax=Neohortaea acidophila TaxID=245834 RepID=A0A6A6PUF3_9PEZI|nr:uncharacterized protein BDY17DRAFT_345987 [Neohortaea acidophila]KAF2483396.1 hypothetical protein BDY17DRAFT_345987 [Neohortaea acidophila]